MSAQNRASEDAADQLYDELYERHGRPLEAEHSGEFVAVSPGGDTILGSSLLEVAQQAKAKFGPGVFVYKIGERAVGRWR